MSKKTTNKTQIICVLDSSGSMSQIIEEARNGFNDFIKKQKKLKEKATVTVALFDSHFNYNLLYDNVDLNDVKKITEKDWYPRSMTALYDGIGRTIDTVISNQKKLKKSERPDKVLVTIVTDGMENDSKEYDHSAIGNLIEERKSKGWQFVYLAANQDAFAVGTNLGVSGGNTFTYQNTKKGNAVMFDKLANATVMYRSVDLNSENYADTVDNLMDDGSDEKTEVKEDTTEKNS